MSDTSESGLSNIECYGYHSCTQAIKIESTSSAYIRCYGAYSCADAVLIQHKIISSSFDRGIECYGLYSCAFVDSIYNDKGLVYCFGELSCAESFAYTLMSFITCHGTRACHKSHIKSERGFNIHGHLGKYSVT